MGSRQRGYFKVKDGTLYFDGDVMGSAEIQELENTASSYASIVRTGFPW